MFGFVVCVSPLLWEPLVAEYPSTDVVVGILVYLWTVVPFFVLAALAEGLKVSRASFLLASGLVTGATLFLQIDVLLYASGSTDALAFLFLPIWLSIAVGVVVGAEQAMRAGTRKLRRRVAR